MPKFLRCTDLIPGCDFVAHGETADEAVARAAEHVRKKHLLRSVTPQIVEHLRSIVRDEDWRAAGGSSAA